MNEQPLPPGQAEAPDAPPVPATPTTQPWWPLLIAGGVLVVAALIIAAVLIWAPAEESGEAAPKHGTVEPTPDAEPRPTPAEDSDEHLDYGPDDPEIDGTGPVAERLQALEDRYKQMYDDGSLWELMSETKENTGAYLAFQFMLADMRSATRFGVDDATQTQYAKRAKHLETLFLTQQPLGTNVEYELQDGRVFSYDGDTGEVGLE